MFGKTWAAVLLFLTVSAAAAGAAETVAGSFELRPEVGNTNASFDALVEQYRDIVGWGDNPLDSMPAQQDSRVNIQRDGQGNPIIEVEDPEAAAFDEKMKAIEKVPPARPIDEDALRLARSYHNAKSAPKPHITSNGRIDFY
ncbi:MAG: hypothetical protein LBR71_05790, partial [Synergistaceae bacterium]|nr:hypothetical protein [Synergistaceae bacterium]